MGQALGDFDAGLLQRLELIGVVGKQRHRGHPETVQDGGGEVGHVPGQLEALQHQAQALGLGHAVLCGQRLVGNEPFAVLLADDLMVGEPPVLQQMVAQFNEWRASILAVQEVPAEHTRRYGIVAGNPVNDRMVDVQRIVEKPDPAVAPSRLGVAGRYILTPGVFHEIATQPRGVAGEIQLTDGIASLLRREKVFAYRYEGTRYDCGSKEGFLQANVELALSHPTLGPGFLAYLQGLEATVTQVAGAVKAPVADVQERVRGLLEQGQGLGFWTGGGGQEEAADKGQGGLLVGIVGGDPAAVALGLLEGLL